MTPVSLNPPGPSIQDQSQLFISPNNHEPTSLSYRTFFDILDQRQTGDIRDLRHDHQEDGRLVFHGGYSSSNIDQVCNSSSVSPQPVMVDPNSAHGHNLSLYKVEELEENKNVSGSAKWMSSKIRLTRKMITPTNNIAFNTTTTPTFRNQGHGNTQAKPSTYNGNSIIRVCSDCKTSSTPLWRSGPKGPKSLCNACGIRQRKARRAMAEAANGFAASMMDASSTKTKVVHQKEKKSRTKHFAQFKNKSKAISTTTTAGTSEGERKLDFKDFAVSLRNNSAFQQVFPRDEVAEAALLLMELSCGFVYF